VAAETSLKSRVFVDQNMEKVELHPFTDGVATVFSSRSPDKESGNEDAAALIPFDAGSGILVVADGVGGSRSGQEASHTAIRALESALKQGARNGDMLRTAILNGIESANRNVIELGVGAATTLALVELQEGIARPYHIGDSEILIMGQRGRVKLQTVSHSPVGFAVEAGFLDHDEAMHHEERHVVSNVIGSTEMRIEVGANMALAARDSVLLGSDGLFDNLRVEEIVQLVRKGPLERAAGALRELATRRMHEPREDQPSKPDDLTFVVFRRQATAKRRLRKPTEPTPPEPLAPQSTNG
jgi:serine/threonine protein phosphatase PrpC